MLLFFFFLKKTPGLVATTSKLFIPQSEEDVFGILVLDWIDLTMRNADV